MRSLQRLNKTHFNPKESDMKTVSIGRFKEDGTFTVVCTLTNNGGHIHPVAFEALGESTALALAVHLGREETIIMEQGK